ncbi:hypothetical protein BMS3Abin03_02255 [bacterium BMS3Abin03]|nr:hypothetical protein BMS3Abin03_02255 [bacterium BMS3Abin03]
MRVAMIKAQIIPSLIFTVFILQLISCTDADKIVSVNMPLEFVPGQVVVGFEDSVSLHSADEFIYNLGFTSDTMYFDSSFSVWVRVDSGKAIDYENIILQITGVCAAFERTYPYDDIDSTKSYLLVCFDGTVDTVFAKDRIESVPNLIVSRVLMHSKMSLINVPVGREIFWRDSLRTLSIIKWAELNYIAHIN